MSCGRDLIDSGDAYTRSRDTTEHVQRSAVRYVLRRAHGPDDARHLLDVLGLLDAAEGMKEAS